MENKEDEGFFHSLSRKELQSLCKKYGLPAKRSHSDMAKSLASYLENQRLVSMTSGERFYGIQEAGNPLSLKLQLQPGASLNTLRDAGKDHYGLISCPLDRCNGGNYSQAVQYNALGCCTGDKFYHKDGGGGDSILFQRRPHSHFVSQYDDSGFKNKEFQTISSSRDCLSLSRDGRLNDMPQIGHEDTDFHVSSEEGINLYVDLNSNPSEWIEKLKSEVSISQDMSHCKSKTFPKELGRFGESSKQMERSFQLNVDTGEMKDDFIHSGLPPNLIIKETSSLQFDHPDRDNGSFGSAVMIPCGRAVDLSEHLEGDRGLTLVRAHPDSQEQIISAIAPCAKDGWLVAPNSNINSPREKLGGDGALNISNGPLSLLRKENEICENCTLQSSCHLVSSGRIIPGCQPDGSLLMQKPEDVVPQKDALHSPGDNGEFVDLVDPKHKFYADQGGLAGSTDLNQETFRTRLPTLVEEQDKSKINNWGESSEGLDNVESNGLSKKRACIDGDKNDCSLLDAKILRSTKHLIKVLPRRSTRLVSK
ncbi:hypothetical protein V6Z11_A03G110200 [Gossypium hirsutum]